MKADVLAWFMAVSLVTAVSVGLVVSGPLVAIMAAMGTVIVVLLIALWAEP